MSEREDAKILLLCDELADTASFARALNARSWRLVVVHDVNDALRMGQEEPWLCAVVCDDGKRTRLDAFLRQRDEKSCPVIGGVRQGDVARSVVAMQLGAVMIVEMRPGEVLPSASSVLSVIDESIQIAEGTRGQDPRDRIVRAPDSPMNGILDVLPQLALADAPVLITGESGTGKDLFARALHELSARADAPFIPVNCGAIPNELLEAELFGYVKGAFTGAEQDRIGQFEAAQGGTIFLDEIGEMPAHLQVKLLRVLQDKQVTPVGSTTPRHIDFRVVAASNRDLEQAVATGEFREDLFYRLGVLPIHLPALRERPQDIPVLSRHFIEVQNDQHRTDLVDMTREVYTLFKRYEWPGNIRELENLIERLCILKGTGFIERDDIPPTILAAPVIPSFGLDVPSEGIDMTDTLERLEKRLLTSALVKAEGNKARAARLLGINRTTLVEKLKRKQISLDDS